MTGSHVPTTDAPLNPSEICTPVSVTFPVFSASRSKVMVPPATNGSLVVLVSEMLGDAVAVSLRPERVRMENPGEVPEGRPSLDGTVRWARDPTRRRFAPLRAAVSLLVVAGAAAADPGEQRAAPSS